ncbi:MAG TPA: hydantoinase/oxoprolinase family protein, partial [Acetobacteraceae bacterium]|nr:hydantoinase/oxoprolinase family protein [Acetobacteraceae bacterium]
SVQRGHDPRDYTLVAFGGAGPLHAARLARELEIRRVLIPVSPGILCAMGLLLTDLRADFALTRLTVLNNSALPVLRDAFAALAQQAEAWFEAEAVAPDFRRIVRTADIRYAGQNYELPIPVPEDATTADLVAAFAAAHHRAYGFIAEDEPIQLVTFRLEASAIVPKAGFTPQPDAGPDAGHAVTGERPVFLPEASGWTTCPIYDRTKLRAGNRITGPAIIEQMDATTIVLPAMTATVEPYLNLVLETAA